MKRLIRAPGRPLHGAGAARFALEHQRADRIDREFEQNNMHRIQKRRQAQQHWRKCNPGNRHMDGGDIGQCAAQISKDAPPHADAANDRDEAVVEQRQIGRFARHVRALPAHGDADMGGLQGGRVINAVAGHGDDFAVGFQRFNNEQFLLRRDAREHAHVFQPLAQG